MVVVYCGGHVTGMVWVHLSPFIVKGHYKLVQSSSDWSLLPYDEIFLS